MRLKHFLPLLFTTFFITTTTAQIDEDQTGAWYIYNWGTGFGESRFGAQGDIQFRNWDLIGDLEQLLIRGGVTYSPSTANVKFVLGYGHITTGAFGDSDATSTESRIYQEANLPQKLGTRVYLNHRFRYEQRWVVTQDFRTRYRYNLSLTLPLNQTDLTQNAVYLALYNELFMNGQRDIGDNRQVELFDRNRLYGALGYSLKNNLRLQVGYMEQTTDNWSKGQLQLSLHHTF
ncbi:DUF2490 domain-containing protein [Salinimicrobium xinjiangense]|uniref:DUF2490 domain-containing protein n=1 Tax=Salinimicrobium xinjiangense TaxID=438596 RepID=UPI0004001A0C